MRKFILTVCGVLAFASQAKAGSYTALIDFGDSLSDVGNLYTASGGFLPGSPGYTNGRFSNGPIWIDKLSQTLGLGTPTPSLAGGNDYAYGDAVSGTGTTNIIGPLSVPNVQTQVLSYTTTHTANSAELFTVLGGANDVLTYLAGTGTTTPTQAADNIKTSVSTLYADGARNILVANLPDLGLTPRFVGTAAAPVATAATVQFDTELASDLATLSATSPGLKIDNLDLFALIDQVVANHVAYGISNYTQQAYTGDPNYLGGGTAVADPSGYLFWDALHPTATGQGLVGSAAVAAVPEPASIGVIAVATIALARRRSSQY